MSNQISVEMIAARIFEIRNKKVMLDKDLAKLYEVETRVLNQAVKRNITRFPEDFMFILTRKEVMRISQFGVALINSVDDVCHCNLILSVIELMPWPILKVLADLKLNGFALTNHGLYNTLIQSY